ncbi:protein of unknown function [Ruminococcaceae bacterium BL-4]|nr:protein of unknown function [Ruminococcaceae bacterium BL-4]
MRSQPGDAFSLYGHFKTATLLYHRVCFYSIYELFNYITRLFYLQALKSILG